MIGRPMVVRRRPLLRAAAIGGTFAAGRAAGRRAEERADAQQAVPEQSMPQESVPQQAQSQPPPADQGGQPGGSSPVLDQLNQLTAMHDQGALTDQEFAAAKAKILGT
jgi:Short C-terminal domain